MASKETPTKTFKEHKKTPPRRMTQLTALQLKNIQKNRRHRSTEILEQSFGPGVFGSKHAKPTTSRPIEFDENSKGASSNHMKGVFAALQEENPLGTIQEQSNHLHASESSSNSMLSQFFTDLFQTKKANQPAPTTVGKNPELMMMKGKKGDEKEAPITIDGLGYAVLNEVVLNSAKKSFDWVKVMLSDESAGLLSSSKNTDLYSFAPEVIDAMRKCLTTYSFSNAKVQKDSKLLRRDDVRRNEIVIAMARDIFYKFLASSKMELIYVFAKNTVIVFLSNMNETKPTAGFVFTTNPTIHQLIQRNEVIAEKMSLGEEDEIRRTLELFKTKSPGKSPAKHIVKEEMLRIDAKHVHTFYNLLLNDLFMTEDDYEIVSTLPFLNATISLPNAVLNEGHQAEVNQDGRTIHELLRLSYRHHSVRLNGTIIAAKLKEFLELIKTNADQIEKEYFTFQVTIESQKIRDQTGQFRNEIITPPPAPAQSSNIPAMIEEPALDPQQTQIN